MIDLSRLPVQMPMDIAPELPPVVTVGGATYIPWFEGVEIKRDPIAIEYNVTPRQTARGRSWSSGSGKPKNVSTTLQLYLEAPTPLAVARLAQRWRRIMTTCDAYYEGARAVYPTGVLRAARRR